MKLLFLFHIRLKRHRIPPILGLVLIGLVLALNYRNLFQYEDLRLQDRQLMTSLKNEASYVLYKDDAPLETKNPQEVSHYQEILNLTEHYLETEHHYGKNQSVIMTELGLYQTLLDGLQAGRTVNQFTENQLVENVQLLSQVTQKQLIFQYDRAPKDFYLIFKQILPITRFLVPGLTLAICLWLLVTDLRDHRGFLQVNGIRETQYANSLVLFAFLMASLTYLTLFLSQAIFSSYQNLTFQKDYPVYIPSSKSILTVSQVLRGLVLENIIFLIASLILLQLIGTLLLKKKATPSLKTLFSKKEQPSS